VTGNWAVDQGSNESATGKKIFIMLINCSVVTSHSLVALLNKPGLPAVDLILVS